MAHELAENPEIQDKLREEIDQALNDDGLSYDSVMGMKYLDMIVSGKFANYYYTSFPCWYIYPLIMKP